MLCTSALVFMTVALMSPSAADHPFYWLTMKRLPGKPNPLAPSDVKDHSEQKLAHVTFDKACWPDSPIAKPPVNCFGTPPKEPGSPSERWFGKDYESEDWIHDSIWSTFMDLRITRYTVRHSEVEVKCCGGACVYDLVRRLNPLNCCGPEGLPERQHDDVWLEVEDMDHRYTYNGKVRPRYVVRMFWSHLCFGHEKQCFCRTVPRGSGQIEMSVAMSAEDVVIYPMRSCCTKIQVERPCEPDDTWTKVEGNKPLVDLVKTFRDWRYNVAEGNANDVPRQGNCQTAVRWIQTHLDRSEQQKDKETCRQTDEEPSETTANPVALDTEMTVSHLPVPGGGAEEKSDVLGSDLLSSDSGSMGAAGAPPRESDGGANNV